MNAASALRSKVAAPPCPVMPGVAAVASGPCSVVTTVATIATQNLAVMWLTNILLGAARLGLWVHGTANVHLGHQPAEVLRIVRQVIQVGGVEIKSLTFNELGFVGGIEDHVDRLTPAQRDRVG